MSTVHLAFDQRLERYVAIKLLAEHLADDPTFVSRFRREALAAARLVHPNIVQVFDFGFDERQRPALHRDGARAGPLLRRAPARPRPARGRRGGRRRQPGLPRASTTRTATASCTATSSPATCSSPTPTCVKLADFGIARATDQSSITQVGSVLGTAAYLAPEQARGEEAGPRADLYSLGVVTYQLISGRLPYEAARCPSSRSSSSASRRRRSTSSIREVPPELAERGRDGAGARPARTARPPRSALAEALHDGARGVAPVRDRDATRTAEASAATRVRRRAAARPPRPARPDAAGAGRRPRSRAGDPRRAPAPPRAPGRRPPQAAAPRSGRAGRGPRRLLPCWSWWSLFVAAVRCVTARSTRHRDCSGDDRRPAAADPVAVLVAIDPATAVGSAARPSAASHGHARARPGAAS